MQFYRKTKRPPTIVIVSLIDILVLLLIFFIVTTTFREEQPVVEIQLPDSKTAKATTAEQPMVVSITQKDEVFLDEKSIALDKLAEAIILHKKEKAQLKIALKADKKASFGIVVQVLDAFKQAGVENIPAFTAPSTSP